MWIVAGLVAGLGASLLFVAQPAAAKAILPRLGGTPAAWGATLLFFQVGLIGGYAAVDRGLRAGGTRGVALTQTGLLVLAATVLLLLTPFGTPAPAGPATLTAALRLLATQLGLPVLALALTAPAIQAWIASRGPAHSRESYVLYAASNTGSLLGLLAYPWLVEPSLTLSRQWQLWRIGFLVLTGAVLLLWFSTPAQRRAPHLKTTSAPPPLRSRLEWIGRAAIPAALLAAVTEYLTRDIAPVPFLWVIPLALYLATWIIGFSPRAHALVRAAGRVQDLAVVVAVVIFLIRPYLLVGPLLALLALVVVGITQHGALARSAPPPDLLGRFYVHLAVGGAAGTALVVVVGPTLLPLPLEAPLALIAALALGRPSEAPRTRWTSAGRLGFLAVGALGMAAPLLQGGASRQTLIGSLSIGAGVAAMLWRSAPRRVALALLLLVALDATIRLGARDHVGSIHNVLGRLEVRNDANGTMLISGSTLHGFELPGDSTARPHATLYYRRQGPYGDLVGLFNGKGPGFRLGVVGLGIGSLGCTAEPGAAVTYFEINPGVVRLARDTTLFRSLTRCTPDAAIRLGDARLSLEAFQDQFDLLTLDAFNSDAIPTHLLTREAFAVYRRRLAPEGIIAFHVTNRFLQLAPVVAALAGESGWVAAEAVPWMRPEQMDGATDPPVWVNLVALAEDSAALRPLVASGRWHWLATSAGPAWSDDWTPLASALRITRAAIVGR